MGVYTGCKFPSNAQSYNKFYMPSLKYEGNFAVLRMCSLFFLPIPAISSPHCSSCSHLPICTARHQARNLAAGKLHRGIVEVQVNSPFHALSCSLRKLDFDKIKFCLLIFSKFYLVVFFFGRSQLFVLTFFDLFVWRSLLLKHLKQGIL